MSTDTAKESSTAVDRGFVLEEYKLKRAYIRHIEDTDLKVQQWYFLIVGTGLAFLWKDANSIWDPLQRDASIPVLGFLVIYSVMVGTFIALRKHNHLSFVTRVLAIEEEWCGTPPDRSSGWLRVSYVRRALVNLLGAACTCLLAYACFPNTVTALFAAFVYFVVSMRFPGVTANPAEAHEKE